MSPERADVIVVGGGPAGLSAALLLARACRRVVVFDEGRPRNAVSRAVHNFLSRDGVPPAELLAISREQLLAYPNAQLVPTRVVAARADEAGFEISTADGARFRCRKLVLATGLVDRLPAVPGMRELYGKGVYSCPYCDGWELKDQPLAVHGGSDACSGELALELLVWSRDVVLCTDGPAQLSQACRDRLERNGVRIREERITGLHAADGQLERVTFESGEPLPRRAMFVFGNYREASDLAAHLGSEGFSVTGIRVERRGRAGVPGLFVIGDAVRDVLQVAVAAGEGCETAITVNHELLQEDLR